LTQGLPSAILLSTVPLSLLPKTLSLTALSESQVNATRRRAIYQASSYYDTGTILDEHGDPFDLGPTLSPLWAYVAQVRRDVADRADVIASFTVEVLDGPVGSVAWSMTPAVSVLLDTDEPLVWDFDVVNNDDPAFPSTWRATVWRGPVSVIQDVTRS